LPTVVVIRSPLARFALSEADGKIDRMNYFEIMSKVEGSSTDDWTKVGAATPDGHHEIYVFHEDASITLAWGIEHMEGESWTEAWSEGGGFPDSRIHGYYLDVRYNGVPISRDLVLSVDGGRGTLPSGLPIGEEGKGIVGMRVSEPELKRARLLDELMHGSHSEFDRYRKSANIQLR
jgi:hypothetical protein